MQTGWIRREVSFGFFQSQQSLGDQALCRLKVGRGDRRGKRRKPGTQEVVAHVVATFALLFSSKDVLLERAAGLTQAELAKAIGSSQSRIAKMEGGDPQASLESLVRALVAAGGKPKLKVA